jgi:hypothetical protein
MKSQIVTSHKWGEIEMEMPENNWNQPNEFVFEEAMKMLGDMNKMTTLLNMTSMGTLMFHSPYYPKMSGVSDALLELIMLSLNLTDFGGDVCVRGDIDVSMDREAFYEMLYTRCNDTPYIFTIYAAFVKYDRAAMATLHKDYGLKSKYLN